MSRPPLPPLPLFRIPAVDAARGVAVLAMIIYHFCWDINDLRIASLPLLTHTGWLLARVVILSSFLALVGVGLVLAHSHEFEARGWGDRGFWRRLGRLVLAAMAVSAASSILYPDSPIAFGVLHHIAVAYLLGTLWLRLGPGALKRPWPLAGLGVIALMLPSLVQGGHAPGGIFDHPALLVLGLASYEPVANDFVPLFPWLGVVLLGMAGASGWARTGSSWRPAGALSHGFVWVGRHSLAIYLLHQPLLFGALTALVLLTGIGVSPLAPRGPFVPIQNRDLFIQSCRQECVRNGGEVDRCISTCTCLAEEPPELFAVPQKEGADSAADDPRRFAAIARCLLPVGEESSNLRP